MIMKTAGTQIASHRPAGNSPSAATRSTAEGQVRRDSSIGTAEVLTDRTRSQHKELEAVRREHTKLQQAIYEAAQVQRRLCSPRELVWGEFEIAGEIFPVRHLSGDFFKVIQLDGVLGLVLGDIAGKGLSAGIWQAHLMDLIQRCSRTHLHPADAVAAVNRELCLNQSEPPITALFFARLDPERNELVYCNAGLPPPLVLRRNQSVQRLEEGGPMLGALQKATYSSGSVDLNPGDMLLAYSDGLTECRNSQEEEFETGRLSAAAKSLSGATANKVLFSTLATVLDFAGACPPEDDLTLLIVRRREVALADRTSEHNGNFSVPRRQLTTTVRPRQVTNRQAAITNS
ncbi:MAG TPA: PP2C family protein-serine/threonine phosphatase [Candidatus Acidoferrum sp.]|nr:PP2C family protein-serine/threonine phosphatase [Candidatus Acidoferrum sp.]